MLHVLEEAAGQSYTAPGSQGLGYLLFAELIIILTVPVGVHGVDHGLAHLFQELVNKDALHFGANLGQVTVAVGWVFGLILPGIERTQARGSQGGGR